MNETVKLAKLLHDTPDLFLWVCLAIVCIVVLSQHERISAYFDARIEAYGAKREQNAVLSELIRNNTAALDNNTAALESVKADRGETRRMLTYHEEASKERMNHIQTVVNRIDGTVTKNEKNLFVLKDRDDEKRR